MTRTVDPAEFRTSALSRGRCFVYVLPCAYEDILKLGFSRDPLGRLQTLHRRYFDFFDLERGLLIETETVRDARGLELTLAAEIEAHNAPAPLVTRREAGGHTEWYRGAFEHLQLAAGLLASAGYTLHEPALPWLRSALLARSDRLFAWSTETLLAIDSGALPSDVAAGLRESLRDALDAYAAFAIDLEPLLPPAVYRWHRVSGSG
jgi:hypothetical protein